MEALIDAGHPSDLSLLGIVMPILQGYCEGQKSSV